MTAQAPERVIEFPALKEARDGLNAKRDELAGIFREAGPEYDMTKVKSIAGDTQAKVDHIRQLNAEIDDRKAKVDELTVIAKAAGVARDAEEVERGDQDLKGGDGSRAMGGRQLSFGELFVKSTAFTGFQRAAQMSPQTHIDVPLKSLLTTGSWTPETTRTGRIEEYPTRPAPHVADLIPQTTTNQIAVVYMEETVYVNTAAEIGEGEQYPEAQLKLEEKSSSVRKIAVFLPVTDELFEDEPRAESYVNNRLPFMLRQRLDAQILVGNGSAPNLLGSVNVPGIISQAKGSDPAVDAIYKGFRQIRDTGFAEPSAVFMRPAVWEPIRLMRTADGIYIWGHPSMPGPVTLWGVPVTETTAAPATKAIAGDYANFAELAVRRGVDVQVSNSHADYFISGKLAIRADLRVALIHYRPKAFCEITGL